MMLSLRRNLVLAVLILAMLAMTSCVKSAEPREVRIGAAAEPTATPAPIVFPQDELVHDSRLEWWYHSGHLESESGRKFGFHFVVFKSDTDLGEPNLVAQLGLLDVETGEHYDLSRAEGGLRMVGGELSTIGIANWIYEMPESPGSHSFSAATENLALSLKLVAESPVMLHKQIGWLPTELGATYYYSWPRQRATGELTLNGETFNVTGTGWFDHQWGDFFVLGKPSGWQWLAIQLGDGASLMITESRDIDGNIAEIYGTYLSSGGTLKHLDSELDGIDLAVVNEWTSPTTGGVYPSGWTLKIGSLGLELTLKPVADDQEVQGGLPVASTYWEGKVAVTGNQNGTPISGDAYVELSGYVDPEPIEWLHR